MSSEDEPECQIWDPTGRVIALTEVIARIQYLPLVPHEKRGQALLAPRSFSREQRSYSGQCAFDLPPHALNLALQECLKLLEFGHESFEPVDRIRS